MSQRRIKRPPRSLNLGPTGQFPEGQNNPHDEGELRFAVSHDPQQRTVVVDFGTPVSWIGMPPETAIELATALVSHARQCAQKGTQ